MINIGFSETGLDVAGDNAVRVLVDAENRASELLGLHLTAMLQASSPPLGSLDLAGTLDEAQSRAAHSLLREGIPDPDDVRRNSLNEGVARSILRKMEEIYPLEGKEKIQLAIALRGLVLGVNQLGNAIKSNTGDQTRASDS